MIETGETLYVLGAIGAAAALMALELALLALRRRDSIARRQAR
jgi:hypothetical protein